jgi:hypothetical protein
MLKAQRVNSIDCHVHLVCIKRRRNTPTFCARVLGVTITVNQAENGVWHWAPWSDSVIVAERLHKKADLAAQKKGL